MTDDFYDLLDVDPDASQDEIKQAFRTKVREYHPDLNDDPRAPAQFTALKKAYDTLGNSSERNAYDRMGHEDYVAKRLKGLPSRDAWATSDSSSSSSTSSTTTSASSSGAASQSKRRSSRSQSSSSGRSSGSNRSSSTSQSTGSSRSDSSRSSSSSRSSGRSTRSSSTASTSTATSSNRTTTSSGTGNSASGTAAGAGGAATRTHTRTGSGSSEGGALSRLTNVRVGLRGIYLSGLLYVAGLALYAYANLGGVKRLVTAVQAAGTEPNAIWAALQARRGIEPLSAYLSTGTYVDGMPAAGVAMLLGMVLLPATFLIVIRRTRKNSSWKITYLYVLATVAPLVGLAIDYGTTVGALSVNALYVDLLAYALLPVGAFLALPVHVFVHRRL